DPAAMKVVAEFPANQRYVRESKWPWWTRPATRDQHQFTLRSGKGLELKDGTTYSMSVAAVLNDDRVIATPVQVTPEPNWVNWNQMNNLWLRSYWAASCSRRSVRPESGRSSSGAFPASMPWMRLSVARPSWASRSSTSRAPTT